MSSSGPTTRSQFKKNLEKANMAITFTTEQFQEFLQNIKASLRVESAQTSAQPDAATPHQRNFSKCLS